MNPRTGMALNLLATGVPGLDAVLGGGVPEYSFNLVAGPPGAGKTTLIHQLIFANASAERPVLYFTALGEPSIKMLRYQQQMQFFDPAKVGDVVTYVDLSQDILGGSLDALLTKMEAHVKAVGPAIVVVDSFRSLASGTGSGTPEHRAELQGFMQRLALTLTGWQVTSFLLGEYSMREMEESPNPVFTIADSILYLSREKQRHSIVRKLEVLKSRGMAAVPGLHTFRIKSEGIQVFTRLPPPDQGKGDPHSDVRAGSGIPGLDALIGGGLPAGDLTIITGPSGTGKTAFCTHFVAEGGRLGEPSVLAIFEETTEAYLARARRMGFDLDAMVDAGLVRIIYLRPLDLSPDEIIAELQHAVTETGARRVVIDSLNGLELALAPSFREDFAASLYRLVGWLSNGGVSVVFTIEVSEAFDEMKFSPHAVSFMAQNILFFRYVEVEGELKKVLAVIKMRRSAHSKSLHGYDVGARGMIVSGPLATYRGILTGVPVPIDGQGTP